MKHFSITWRILFSALALCLAMSAVAVGQEITGNIVGTVKDGTGAAVKAQP